MAALGQAIKASDSARFATAYEGLTVACNTCHRSADRGVIVIQSPSGSPFADQDFRPVKEWPDAHHRSLAAEPRHNG
jgi:hypothetical protein